MSMKEQSIVEFHTGDFGCVVLATHVGRADLALLDDRVHCPGNRVSLEVEAEVT